MNIEQIEAIAKEIGTNGGSYHDAISRDDVMEAAALLDESGGLDTARIEAAYREGRRAHRASNGWIFVWTTAPEDYDQFGTETAEVHEWKGKALRRVLAHPHHVSYQAGRYGSGGHPMWDENPRITEARIRETVARENAEREAAQAKREAGLVWIREVSANVLDGDEDAFDAMLHERGLMWKDVRDERKRRADEEHARKQAEQWERCRAWFADGATIVDEGADARRTDYGVIPARDANVWRGVSVRPHYAEKQNADLARVVDENHCDIGSLEYVAARFARGELRVALPDEHLPPAVVLERFAGSRLNEILRVEAFGRVVWVGSPRFSYDPLVVDERGAKARKRDVIETANAAWRQRAR